MFSKGGGSVETLIGKECEIKGNLYSKNSIRIDGRVEGNVESGDTVIVGETAAVKGDVMGKHVVIGGSVTGDVTARVKLEILHTGRLYGDINASRLAMSEGVIFEGNCEMEAAGVEKK